MSQAVPHPTFSAFTPDRCLATGDLESVAMAAYRFLQAQRLESAVILDDATCQIIDLDLSGGPDLITRRAQLYPLPRETDTSANNVRQARQVDLLPRHWQWLDSQQGDAAAALMRLVDDARRDPQRRQQQRIRAAQQLTFRFCQSVAGDLPGYEEMLRALYTADYEGFCALTAKWPKDIATRAIGLAEDAWLNTKDLP